MPERVASPRPSQWRTICLFMGAVGACLILATHAPVWADPAPSADFPLNFSVFRQGTNDPVVLVVGGIQGDEPGGFSAATLLSTQYRITQGTLWVVPNLNFPSIIRRSRGVHGDMNRKFAVLAQTDPEFPTVVRIQELIRAPEVRLVLNLHDGSGYFRPRHEDRLHSPLRWGQSIIIDQERMGEETPLQQLAAVADAVVTAANKRLLAPGHRLHVRNTRTAEGDKEMEKSLSWFAVRHGKAAFGLEASKEFPVEIRTYYHLHMVENFLTLAGIRFERDFELSPKGIRAALQSDLHVAFAEQRVLLPLEDARPHINLLPLPKDNHMAVASKPIMAVLPDAGQLTVHYGNRTVTRIRPDWRDMDRSLGGVRITVDGQERDIPFGQVVPVHSAFTVHPLDGYRVNAIGAELNPDDESGMPIRRKDFKPRFSVDKQGTLYRVEVYRGQRFSGMFLVRFGGKESLVTRRDTLPAVKGKESSLGY